MRKRMVPALLALAALAVVAFSATPATAGPTQQSLGACPDPAFDFLAGLQHTGTARGAAAGDPTTRAEKDTEKYSGSTEFGQKTPGKPTAGEIDVYVHVVTKTDGTGAVSDAAIDDQIMVLNQTFAGWFGGDDTGFTFRLAGVTRTANDAWYAQDTFADEVAMKSALKQGDAADLNLYTTSGGGFLGWAYYPSITASNQYSVLDGVVVHYGSLPGGSIQNFNLGYTATHEVGHYLGLAHTFEQGCIGHGDYVDDTPYEATPTSGCPSGKDTCTRGSGDDPIHNYMDYSYDPCYTQFTPGQTERMQKQFAHWRLKRI
jgi:pregnancy-associated plasma protein-A